VTVTGGSNIAGYVAVTGSSLSGTFTMQSGASIVNTTSGVNNLGSSNLPFANVFTKTINATYISGLSPVTFLSSIIMSPGSTITTSGTGVTIGSSDNPISTLYVSNIIGATGLDATQIVHTTGSAMTGSLTMNSGTAVVLNSGASVSAAISGTAQIGSTGSYLGNVYTNAVNNRPIGNMVFNELLTGTTDGVNRTFFFSHKPASNYATVFYSGLYVRPGVDYVFSGNAIVFTGSFAAPVTSPYAGFYVY
jgi:hypothetical protein